MKSSSRPWMSLLGLVAGCHLSLSAHANTCTWTGAGGAMDFQADVGTVYVPRDAAVGTIIGVIDQRVRASAPGHAGITCSNDGSVVLDFNARVLTPFEHKVNAHAGRGGSTDQILTTNIPGVGAIITLETPLTGTGSNSFIPVAGSSVVPYDAIIDRNLVLAFQLLNSMFTRLTLVKTGVIAPGPQRLNRQMFDGYFSGIGKGFGYGLSGTVIQSQCAVGADPVSLDPVPLGDWNTSDFTHPGFTTTPTSFRITLTRCESDSTDRNIATAFISLDGANGSLPEGDGSNGVFSLSSGSTATGIGIQILRADGTPVPLVTDVSFGAIKDGVDKTLDFKAQYYQILDSSQIRPGKAEGALGFTVTFQ